MPRTERRKQLGVHPRRMSIVVIASKNFVIKDKLEKHCVF